MIGDLSVKVDSIRDMKHADKAEPQQSSLKKPAYDSEPVKQPATSDKDKSTTLQSA